MNESLLNRILKDHKRRTRSLALILCLSMIVSLGTFAGFHQTAIAKVYTREVLDCPYAHEGAEPVAHVHNDDCYEGETLVCTLPEREAHTHDDTCYAESRMLSCGLEENPGHQHTEACFDENGELICQIPEGEGAHAHTDACYTIERALVCNQPELPVHVHDAGCFRTEEISVDEPEEAIETEQAVSAVPEMPVSDPDADLETSDDWNREFENLELSGNWARDLVLVAATQQGRGESPNNFEAVLNDAGDAWVRHGYTRYGAWYGYPYAEWDAMFVSFCLRYAGIPVENVPNNPTAAFMAESFSMGELFAGRDYVPAAGDLIFFDTVADEITNIDHMGIVYHVDAENGTINTVEGDRTDAVATFGYYLNDEQIVGYGILPQNPNYIPVEGENTDNTDEAFDGFIFMTTDEEEEPEETPAAEEAPAPVVPMPAQSWERTAGGIKVSVEAPEGAFPENTKIAVTPVNGSSLKDTVSDAVSGEVLEVQAVDITFFDAEGREIEPAVPIRVVMTPAATEHAEEKTSVVHVDVAQQTAELIEQAEGTETDNSEVVFDADAFTIYAIVYTVDFEYEVNGKLFTSSMPGAEDMPLSEIVKGLGIVGEEELDTFLSKIVSVTSTNEEVAVVTEDRSVRVLKDGDAQIVITMQDGAAFSISVEAEGVTEISDENAVATVSTVNDLYLPAAGEVKAELLTEEQSETVISAVQTATEIDESSAATYQAFSIALENVDVTAYNGFNVAVTLPEDAVVGRDFQLYQVLEDGTATDLTGSLELTGEKNEEGLQNLSAFSFTTDDFADFVLSYSIETFYKAFDGQTFKIALNYGPKAGIPDGAELEVREILPEDEDYGKYLNDSAAKLGVESGAVSFARFFDIEIKKDGEKIEPLTPVQVSISLTDAPAETAPEALTVVHFAEAGLETIDETQAAQKEDASVELIFDAESFSVYGVIVEQSAIAAPDLAGKAAKIGANGRYLTNTTNNDNGRPWTIGKTSNIDAAADYTFEPTATPGLYNIYTVKENVKYYLRINHENDDPDWGSGANGSVNLTENDPMGLNVSRRGDGSYRIFRTINGRPYYLNEHYGNGGNGFASYTDGDAENSKLSLTFSQPKEYMVVVKQGDSYFIVLNDGKLTPAVYDPANNTVAVDDPMMWRYDGERLYHVTGEAGFNGDDLASSSYYRYIDPNEAKGWSEDDKTNTTQNGTSGQDNGVIITSRDLWNNVKITYTEGHKLQSASQPNSYIGVKNGALIGQVSESEAVEVFFADPLVEESDWMKHRVNHIDISINGNAEVDVPLAYGKYYDENGNLVKEVSRNQFEKLHLTKAQVVNENELNIEPADMKRAHITATCNGSDLDNAFYITGYTGNAEHAEHGGDGTDYVTSPQVRIEGSFLVANMPQEYATVDRSKYDSDETYRNAIRQKHLANKVEYSVSVVKSIQFYLEMPVLDEDGKQIKDDQGNPVYQRLYDADGKELTIRADVAFSDSFDYWDEGNECPVFTDTGRWYYYKKHGPGSKENNWPEWYADSWEDGDVARCNFSGMDFKLGGSGSQSAASVYALEITKIVVDEQGNRIKSDNIGNTKFYIYRKPVETIDSVEDSSGKEYHDVVKPEADTVKDLNVGSFSGDEAYAGDNTGYDLLREKTIQVGDEGYGLVYDYDVTPALYYVEEDPDSVAESITDITGKEWNYKQTYIWTEYTWRDCSNDSYMHVGQTYTEKPVEGGYKGVPEILGNHYSYDGTKGPYTNDFLEFYVYNVYESPKVDVPVVKTWTDFNGDEFSWNASFKLQWAPVYPDETAPHVNFRDVTPAQSMTITKADMADLNRLASEKNVTVNELVKKYCADDASLALTDEEKSVIRTALETLTFSDLPKYGTDANGNTYRIQYSLEETAYNVYSRGNLVYAWSEDTGYNSDDEDTHYVPFYPHDAGEDSEDDSDYYVSVNNAKRNISSKETININLKKRWDIDSDGTYESDDSYFAEFELKRFIHTEYRDVSHMSDSDRTAEKITITIKNGNEVVNTLEVQPNVGLYLGANFAPHTSAKSVSFTADKPVTFANGSRSSSLTVTAEGENLSNALVRSQEFFVNQDTVFTIGDTSNLVEGGQLARVLDTGAGSPPMPDRSFSQTVRLDSSNEWTADLEKLLRSVTSSGDDDDNENVTYYEYYLVEKTSNPDGYAQYFRADADGNPTGVLSGDSDHQIEHNDNVVAVNGPSNRLIVRKVWRGVPDTTGFPGITFTLYRSKDENGNTAEIVEKDGVEYRNIELKGNNLEWICPVELEPSYLDNGQSHPYYYYVQEDERSGSMSSEDKNGNKITTSWEFYYYLSSYKNEEGKLVTKQKTSGNQGYQAAIYGTDIARAGGTITICNKLGAYEQLDIRKKFFELQEAGSWADTTETSERMKDVILGIKVLRAIKTADGKYINEKGEISDTRDWMEYSDELLLGYDHNGKPVVQNTGENKLWLSNESGWKFRINENQGDKDDVNTGGSGLPTYGFYILNGEDIVVQYEYTYRETNVYQFAGQDADGTIHVAPNPTWDWYSTILPMELKPDYQGRIENAIANYQASDLIIDKDWLNNDDNRADVNAVYVKVWRQSGNEAPEDFTAVIAEDVKNNHNWQMYLSDESAIDLSRKALILSKNADGQWNETALKVNRALLGALNETGAYTYYIQEVGYKTSDGMYRPNVGRFNPIYTKWTGTAEDGNWQTLNEGSSDGAGNAISIGAKGENKLRVTNRYAPASGLTVTKAFAGVQQSGGQSSMNGGRYPTDGAPLVVLELKQRYRYEYTKNGVTYVLRKDCDNVQAAFEAIQSSDPVDLTKWIPSTEPEADEQWLVDWQAAESGTPQTVTLPQPKPDGTPQTDQEWYASANAWTYTWDGLELEKTLREDSAPKAKLYYRIEEKGCPDWLTVSYSEGNENGYPAQENVYPSVAVTNSQGKINLQVNKEWTGLGKDGVGKPITWPEGYVVSYQVIQHFHLVNMSVDSSENSPKYNYSPVELPFKTVDMVRRDDDGNPLPDTVHQRAVGTLEKGSPSVTIEGLPASGFYLATAEDEVAGLVAGKVYPVAYTYSVKETGVTKNGTPVDFTEQTVDAEKSATENNVYSATLTNEFTHLKLTKVWTKNGQATENFWPTDYTVEYTVIRESVLEDGTTVVETDESWYVVNNETNNTDILSSEKRFAEWSGLPTGGTYTATAEDTDKGLTEGQQYPVTYTYKVKETKVNVPSGAQEYTFKTDVLVTFIKSTVNEPEANGEAETETPVNADSASETSEDSENREGVYEATLTNDLTDVEAEKTWSDDGDHSKDTSYITLYRYIEGEQLISVTVENPESLGSETIKVTIDGVEKTISSSNPTVGFTLTDDNDHTISYTTTGNITLSGAGGNGNAATSAKAGDAVTIHAENRQPDKDKRNVSITLAFPDGIPYPNDNWTLWAQAFTAEGQWTNQKDFSVLGKNNISSTVEMPTDKPLAVQFGTWSQGGNSFAISSTTHTLTPNNSAYYININAGTEDVVIALNVAKSEGGSAEDNPTWRGVTFEGVTRSGQNVYGDLTYAALVVNNTYGLNIELHGTEPQIANLIITLQNAEIVSQSKTTWGEKDGVFSLQVKPTGGPITCVVSASSTTNLMAKPTIKALKSPLRAAAPETKTEFTGDDLIITSSITVPNLNEMTEVDTFSDNGSWTKKWENLPTVTADGKKISYYVIETKVNTETGYKSITAVHTYTDTADGKSIVIKNTPEEEDKIDVSARKSWKESDNVEITDSSIVNQLQVKVGLYDGDTLVETQDNPAIITGNGTATWTGLDKDQEYTVKEIAVKLPGDSDFTDVSTTNAYGGTVVENQTEGFTITNTFPKLELNIVKIEQDKPSLKLPDAEFKLWRIDKTSKTISKDAGSEKTSKTDDQGEAGFTETNALTNGYYMLQETKIPDGYVLTGEDTIYFKVEFGKIKFLNYAADTAPEDWTERTLPDDVMSHDLLSFTAQNNTLTVENQPGTALPQTGGIGTTLFTALGGLMTATAGAILTIRRKRKPAEG